MPKSKERKEKPKLKSLNEEEDRYAKNKHSFYDLVIKALGIVVSLTTLLVSFTIFTTQQKANLHLESEKVIKQDSIRHADKILEIEMENYLNLAESIVLLMNDIEHQEREAIKIEGLRKLEKGILKWQYLEKDSKLFDQFKQLKNALWEIEKTRKWDELYKPLGLALDSIGSAIKGIKGNNKKPLKNEDTD